MQRQFTGFRAEGVPLGADDVADIEGFERGKGLRPDLVPFDVKLNAPLAVLKLDKGGLAKRAAGQDPSGHDECFVCGVDLFLVAIGADDIGGGMLRPEVVGIWVYTCLPESVNLASSLELQFAEFFHYGRSLSIA